ncbi:hypothetical protein ES702_04860 [subsurface metagenome]
MEIIGDLWDSIKKWLTDNKDWFPTVIAISALFIAILTSIIPIIVRRIIRKKKYKPKFTLDVVRPQFHTTVVSPDNSREKDTILILDRMLSNTDDETTITGHTLRILSPHKYKFKTIQPLHEGDSYYFVHKGKTIRNIVQYKKSLVQPHPLDTVNVYFRVPFVIDETTAYLECKLTIYIHKKNRKWFLKNRKISRKFKTPKKED